jgi:hypothetical protein
MDPVSWLWLWLPVGYGLTVTAEVPVLLLGLSPGRPLAVRLYAGLWLTACTYPVVTLTLPMLIDPWRQRAAYLAVAEPFAAAAECLLFWAAFGPGRGRWSLARDLLAVVAANGASFAAGEALNLIWAAR